MRLAGFDVDSFAEGVAPTVTRSPVFTGTIIPSSNGYRLGGTGATNGSGTSLVTLVIGRSNVFTGTNQLNMSSGQVTITQTNDFTGGTTLTNNGIEANVLGIGSDAAFGTNTITFGASGNTFRTGAVNGDHYVANNISWGSNITSNWVLGGDQANDGILSNQNQGTLAYLGTIDMAGRPNPTITNRPRGTLILGDWKGGAGSGFTLAQSTGGYFSMLSTSGNAGVDKTYSGPTVVSVNAMVVIDGSSSFGSGGAVTMGSGTTAASQTVQVQPGTSSVDLGARAFTITSGSSTTSVVIDSNFNTPSGSTLTLGGVITGTNFANSRLIKTGLGTLVLSGQSPAATTSSAALTVNAGTLRLDADTAGGTVWVSGAPLTLGTASGTYGGGGTNLHADLRRRDAERPIERRRAHGVHGSHARHHHPHGGQHAEFLGGRRRHNRVDLRGSPRPGQRRQHLER